MPFRTQFQFFPTGRDSRKMFGPILITENEFPDSKNLKVKLEVKLFGKKYRGRNCMNLRKNLVSKPTCTNKGLLNIQWS